VGFSTPFSPFPQIGHSNQNKLRKDAKIAEKLKALLVRDLKKYSTILENFYGR
jgi:hypothetical protein